MRSVLKRSFEGALCYSGITRALRARRRGDVIVLAYHNIVPEGEETGGDLSLHLSQRDFARQLDLVARTHDVVPLSALLEPSAPPPRRPRAVVTFDDAYLGAVTAGVEELARRGLPATVFVAPALLGGCTFWWDALSGPRGLSEEVRQHGLEALAGKDPEIRAWAAGRGVAETKLPAHMATASEEDLRRAVGVHGITLGAHTWGHVNLARLEEAELDAELVRPLSWLQERFDAVVPWVTYPYGLYSPLVERRAVAAGYAGGFRVDGGWLPARDGDRAPFALPRCNIPAGMTRQGFELRVSGLLA